MAAVTAAAAITAGGTAYAANQASRAASANRQAARGALLQPFEFSGVAGSRGLLGNGVGEVDSGGLADIESLFLGAIQPGFQEGNQSLDPNVTLDASNPFFAAANQELEQGSRDFGQLANDRLDLLRSQARPAEQRAANNLADRLFSSGQLGTTGGAQIFGELALSQEQADIGRQLAAFDFASQERQQNFQNAAGLNTQALQLAGLDERNFARGASERNAAFGRAFQSFDGLQNLNNIQLQNFQAALNAAIARSNSAAGVATNIVNSNTAAANAQADALAGGISGLADIFAGLS